MDGRGVMAVLSILIAVLAIPCSGAFVLTTMEFEADNGFISITHNVNNKSFSLFMNSTGRTRITTNATEDNLTYSVNSSGLGRMETSLEAQSYNISMTADDNTEAYEGKGTFSRIFRFFNSMVSFGWLRI